MPHYFSLGQIPHKRHTVFRKPDGSLYAEQLVSTEGFSDTSSLVYHCYPPTMVDKIDEPYSVSPVIAEEKNMQHRLFRGFEIKPADTDEELRNKKFKSYIEPLNRFTNPLKVNGKQTNDNFFIFLPP